MYLFTMYDFPKAAAKVLLFFDMTKFFCKKMHFICVFAKKSVILRVFCVYLYEKGIFFRYLMREYVAC